MTLQRQLSATLAFIAFFRLGDASSMDPVDYARKYQLSSRPWEIRYILVVEYAERMQIRLDLGRKENAMLKANRDMATYRRYESLFRPTASFPLTKYKREEYSIEVITFDQAGHVTSPYINPARLTAKTTYMNYLVLVEQGVFDQSPYSLGDWFQGFPSGEGGDFSPAVCDTNGDSLRYEKGWHIDRIDLDGNFGCREWTHQLKDRERPYIDVTSYQKDGTYIKGFMGWSRFEDPPKPVIGLHEKTWWCLHECPAGEKPGVIADIKAWTKLHGFPMPKRPRKQPEFPDADFNSNFED